MSSGADQQDAVLSTAGRRASDDRPGEPPAELPAEDYEPTPWHFKLLVLGLVLYLTYRAVQAVIWLAHRFG